MKPGFTTRVLQQHLSDETRCPDDEVPALASSARAQRSADLADDHDAHGDHDAASDCTAIFVDYQVGLVDGHGSAPGVALGDQAQHDHVPDEDQGSSHDHAQGCNPQVGHDSAQEAVLPPGSWFSP